MSLVGLFFILFSCFNSTKVQLELVGAVVAVKFK